VATTALHPGGYPGRPYGGVGGPGAHDPGRITTLHAYGGAGRLYGSFAGKEPSDGHSPGRITTLQPGGYTGRLYGSFDGKEESTEPAVVTQDVGGRLRLHRIRDEYPPTPSVVCQAVVVPITARVRQPDPLPLLDALHGGLFGGTAFAAAPIRSVGYRTQLPSVAAVAAVGVLTARAGARFTIDGASVTSVISACVARAGARMQMAGVESELQLGDFDDVYAQIDITDDDLATIIAGVVDAL